MERGLFYLPCGNKQDDMPKHPSDAVDGGYLSAGDSLYKSRKYQLTKHQKDWLKCFIEIWNAVDTLWFEKMSQEAENGTN